MSGQPSLGPAALPLRMTVIAAATMANGLGAAGTLPWKLKGEMAYFRKATSSVSADKRPDPTLRNAVIMGRKTWSSIPAKFRPLKHRINIVISQSHTAAELGISASQDAYLFPSLDAAVHFLRTPLSLDRIFIIGGAHLYSACLSSAPTPASHPRTYLIDRLLITRILTPSFPQCDAFLPEIRDPSQLQHDLDLQAQVPSAASSPPDPHPVQPLSTRQWEKSSQQGLRDYLALSDQEGGDDQLSKAIVEEGDVAYQFQMWTRTQPE